MKIEQQYTTEHCIWLIDAVAHLASEATIDSLFGRSSSLKEDLVHRYMDECYQPEIIDHFIKVINKLGEPRIPEEY